MIKKTRSIVHMLMAGYRLFRVIGRSITTESREPRELLELEQQLQRTHSAFVSSLETLEPQFAISITLAMETHLADLSRQVSDASHVLTERASRLRQAS